MTKKIVELQIIVDVLTALLRNSEAMLEEEKNKFMEEQKGSSEDVK